jgi:hypothetical protein
VADQAQPASVMEDAEEHTDPDSILLHLDECLPCGDHADVP